MVAVLDHQTFNDYKMFNSSTCVQCEYWQHTYKHFTYYETLHNSYCIWVRDNYIDLKLLKGNYSTFEAPVMTPNCVKEGLGVTIGLI